MKRIALLSLTIFGLMACQTTQSTQSNPNSRAGAGTESSQTASARLTDIWALRQLNGKAIDKSQFPRKLPYLDVNMRDDHVTGSTGCNRFSGTFKVTGTVLKIGPLMSTKMACANGMSVETEFLATLETADAYKIDGKNLTLYKGITELMLLVKGD